MNNKLSITYSILIIASLFFGCGGPVKEENKNNASASFVSWGHIGNEKYFIIDTKESTSCGGQNKPDLPKEKIKYETKNYEYTDSMGKRLIIQNSFPNGGTKYTDPNGKVWVFASFWSRITNETDNPLELKIDFPVDSFELPSSPGRYFKLFLPSDTMTLEKEHLLHYGLPDLESFLDKGLQKASSLKRTINPKESSAFYVVTLFNRVNREVDCTLRTELSLKGQNLFYKINGKEIYCGKINLKNLKLQKTSGNGR